MRSSYDTIKFRDQLYARDDEFAARLREPNLTHYDRLKIVNESRRSIRSLLLLALRELDAMPTTEAEEDFVRLRGGS